nr:MAG TPA: hypothetical protein [Caudoviricetes sp.]
MGPRSGRFGMVATRVLRIGLRFLPARWSFRMRRLV